MASNFFTLTAHFGQWEPGQGYKSVWAFTSQPGLGAEIVIRWVETQEQKAG